MSKLILSILGLVLIIGAVLFFTNRPANNQEDVSNNKNNTNTPTPTSTSVTDSEDPNWKIYSNSKYNFSFRYPKEWTIEESSDGDATGRVAALRSPETLQGLQDRKIDPGYSYDLVVSFWPTINNEYARGGSWVGQKSYTNLSDFFTDKNALKQMVGTIMVNGQNAYEVGIGGAGFNYGVMVERNGIYELSFETAGNKSQLSSIQKEILSSFKFTK